MRENGRVILGMDRANRFGLMDPRIRAVGKMGLLKDSERLYIVMETFMKATGVTIRPSVMVTFQTPKVRLAQANGKMTCNMESASPKWPTTQHI